jgi:hypothetical protein
VVSADESNPKPGDRQRHHHAECDQHATDPWVSPTRVLDTESLLGGFVEVVFELGEDRHL